MLRKIMILLVVSFMSLQSRGQLNHWFNFYGVTPTNKDLSLIIEDIRSQGITDGIKYKLSTGFIYMPLHSHEWLYQVLVCYKLVDPTVTMSNLSATVANDEEGNWGNDLSTEVNNFYWDSKTNVVKFVPKYNGASKSVPIVIHNGYTVMKRDCGNPLGFIAIQQQIANNQSQNQNQSQSQSTGGNVNIVNSFNKTTINNYNTTNQQDVVDHRFDRTPFTGNRNIGNNNYNYDYDYRLAQQQPRGRGYNYQNNQGYCDNSNQSDWSPNRQDNGNGYSPTPDRQDNSNRYSPTPDRPQQDNNTRFSPSADNVNNSGNRNSPSNTNSNSGNRFSPTR